MKINPIPLAIGFGSMGGEILTRKRTKKALEELVDNYNSKVLPTKQSFKYQYQKI